MPNWCYNGITIKHQDPAMIDRVVSGSATFFGEFLPVPQDLLDTEPAVYQDPEAQAKLEAQQKANCEKYGYSNWYDWCLSNWGTKWDVELEDVQRVDTNTVTARFDSAWSPPIEAYNQLIDIGFEIDAKFYEPGMAFAGTYTNESGEVTMDVPSDPDAARSVLGEELDDYFGISEEMAQYNEDPAE